MKNSLLRYSITLLLLFCFQNILADPQRYQIELIIFSHISEAGLRSEYWPLLPPHVVSPRAIELTDLTPIPESQWILKNEEQSLKRHNNSILFHAAWQVSANDARQGQIVHLKSLDNAAEEQIHELDGSVGIRLERFFNIHFNLRFYLPLERINSYNLTNITTDNTMPFFSFKLNKSLRMRSQELNYIDHPLYGILIKIMPYETNTNT
jgi:hypothetical protein